MRKAFLIYNPASGQRRARRAELVSRVARVLAEARVQAEVCATTHRGSAVQQAQEACMGGFDTVIACGGDGTANEVLNGLMACSSPATLGVLPLGSGNLLASDLGLPSDATAAARLLLQYRPQVVRPGLLLNSLGAQAQQQRYFLVAAGVGSDAELMYRTAVEAKERWGRNAYFLEMLRMAMRGGYPTFHVEWEDAQGQRRNESATLVMAIRAGSFPGLLRFVDLGASLTRDDFRLLLFRTGKVRHFINYFASVATGINWRVAHVDVVYSKWFRCSGINGQRTVYSQADGELLGGLPSEVGISDKTFNLLMPS